jgi:hypothetical protein
MPRPSYGTPTIDQISIVCLTEPMWGLDAENYRFPRNQVLATKMRWFPNGIRFVISAIGRGLGGLYIFDPDDYDVACASGLYGKTPYSPTRGGGVSAQLCYGGDQSLRLNAELAINSQAGFTGRVTFSGPFKGVAPLIVMDEIGVNAESIDSLGKITLAVPSKDDLDLKMLVGGRGSNIFLPSVTFNETSPRPIIQYASVRAAGLTWASKTLTDWCEGEVDDSVARPAPPWGTPWGLGGDAIFDDELGSPPGQSIPGVPVPRPTPAPTQTPTSRASSYCADGSTFGGCMTPSGTINPFGPCGPNDFPICYVAPDGGAVDPSRFPTRLADPFTPTPMSINQMFFRR